MLASGVAVPWALRAQQLLAEDWGVSADVWSVTSWNELRREAIQADEWNLLHPAEEPQVPYVTQKLADAPGPVIAVSDWMSAVPDLIAPFVPGGIATLGTDGFGLSDTRPALAGTSGSTPSRSSSARCRARPARRRAARRRPAGRGEVPDR